MPNYTDLTGLASVVITIAASAFLLLSGLLPGIVRLTKPRLAMLLGTIFVLILIPFSGIPLAAYVRGLSGDLSITTLLLLCSVLLIPFTDRNAASLAPSPSRGRMGWGWGNVGSRAVTPISTLTLPLKGRELWALLILIALAALMLYPMALGIGAFDPYRLGYGDPLFVTALLLVASVAWFWKLPLIALCITFATLAWTVGWYESDNLWDYLLDPLVSIYALAVLMTHALKSLLRRASSR